MGIKALTTGTSTQLAERHQQIIGDQYFASALSKLVTLYPEVEVVMPLLSFLAGALDTDGDDLAGYANTCVLAIWTALDIIVTWKGNLWEGVLTSTEAVLRVPGGKELIFNHEVHECLTEEWQDLVESEEDFAQVIVKAYEDDTKRVLEHLDVRDESTFE
jgi:hypothetical protein